MGVCLSVPPWPEMLAVPMRFKLKSSSSYVGCWASLRCRAKQLRSRAQRRRFVRAGVPYIFFDDPNVVRTWDAKTPECIVCISSMHKVSNPTNVLRENRGQRCLAMVSAEERQNRSSSGYWATSASSTMPQSGQATQGSSLSPRRSSSSGK